MIPIIHTICGNAAFYYTHRPSAGEVMMSKYARNPDGTDIHGEDMYCHGCKRQIMSMRHLKIGLMDDSPISKLESSHEPA